MTEVSNVLSGLVIPEGLMRVHSITADDRTSLSTAIKDNLGIDIDATTVDGQNQLNAIIMNYADANGMSDAEALTALVDGLNEGSITEDGLAAYRDVTDGQLLLLNQVGITEEDVTMHAEANGLSTFQAATEMIEEAIPQVNSFDYD